MIDFILFRQSAIAWVLQDFVNHSHAMILYTGLVPAAICYAAALSNNYAEIDIITHADFRQKGYGKLIATIFMAECYKKGISSLWDCFTNNAGSMNLCKSLGFKSSLPAYKFLTIAK